MPDAPITAPQTVEEPPTDAPPEPILPTGASDELVEADLLVEDVSIDGMCGVY